MMVWGLVARHGHIACCGTCPSRQPTPLAAARPLAQYHVHGLPLHWVVCQSHESATCRRSVALRLRTWLLRVTAMWVVERSGCNRFPGTQEGPHAPARACTTHNVVVHQHACAVPANEPCVRLVLEHTCGVSCVAGSRHWAWPLPPTRLPPRCQCTTPPTHSYRARYHAQGGHVVGVCPPPPRTIQLGAVWLDALRRKKKKTRAAPPLATGPAHVTSPELTCR